MQQKTPDVYQNLLSLLTKTSQEAPVARAALTRERKIFIIIVVVLEGQIEELQGSLSDETVLGYMFFFLIQIEQDPSVSVLLLRNFLVRCFVVQSSVSAA